MAELKTKETEISAIEYIAKIEDEKRRVDAKKIVAIMSEITKHEAKMWGPSIIGFDKYDYVYESGHSGTMCKIGFSPRKAAHTLYLHCGSEDFSNDFAKLGKHTTGKGCLYIKKLSDVDEVVLREIIAKAYRIMNERYPT